MNEQTTTTPTLDSLSSDIAYDVLSNHRRRTLLALLTAHDRTLTVNDLTKEIAVQESDEQITNISGDELVQVAISLRHNHLPKLVDMGFIDYDERRSLVGPTEKLASLEPHLQSVSPTDVPT
ncbi:hypothetical protein CV102_07995 [Natronococcus pandeyae]|uniref:DUF7344 domain-containing protein n=1 Tax=Natronococcus pandeyae TaxID=2055836 RepID=A0A8J8TT26_9EURY|nr:hypothetical protein [Natronococcus pandeyae]TYL39217.1 hypothetical protein CV102_07995 [Natronococcus pandeyae]